MKPLPMRKESFDGLNYDFAPYLLDAVHGDGKKWLWFGYFDDRPAFYVARVDSSCTVGSDNKDEERDIAIIGWIEEQIMEEALGFLSNKQMREYDKKGYIEGERPWPVPPLEGACGSHWGEYTPDEKDIRLSKS